MEGEEERSEKEGSFSKASIPKRILIVLAGGFVNIVFGLVIYFILVSSTGGYLSNKVEVILDDYGAEKAGIIAGDEIVKINNKKIRSISDIERILASSDGKDVDVQIRRNNEMLNIKLTPTGIPSKDTGIYLGPAGEELTTKIISIYPDSPAISAGLEINDVILKVNGKSVESDPYKVVEYIKEDFDAKEVMFTIQRKNEILDISVIPNIVNKYILGVQFEKAQNNFVNNVYYGFWDTKDFTFSIVENVKMLFTGKVQADQLMGPIGISGIVSKTSRIEEFIYVLALISLSLGVTNLLPFPPLDGGKVVIYLIEWVRKKPMKQNVEAGIQMAGFTALIALTIYITYNDVLRII